VQTRTPLPDSGQAMRRVRAVSDAPQRRDLSTHAAHLASGAAACAARGQQRFAGVA
jgi:hypothetical protein